MRRGRNTWPREAERAIWRVAGKAAVDGSLSEFRLGQAILGAGGQAGKGAAACSAPAWPGQQSYDVVWRQMTSRHWPEQRGGLLLVAPLINTGQSMRVMLYYFCYTHDRPPTHNTRPGHSVDYAVIVRF